MNRIDKLFKLMNKKSTIEHSVYFDAEWYAKRYNLKVSEAAAHYLKYGFRHNFDPSRSFSTREYVANNPDVKINPLLHYELYGKYEGRLGVKAIGNGYGKFVKISDVKEAVDKADIISFDIFDTLIVRPFVNDEDIFKYIEAEYGFDHFAFYREEAEKKARLKYQRDVCIEEIYEHMPYRYQDKLSLELKTHFSLAGPNSQLREIYEYCVSKNKKIICISDMYLSADFEMRLLNKCGYLNIEKVYCSSKSDMTKGNGKLYEYVIKQYQGMSFLHFGDNLHSDIIMAENNGIEAVRVSRNFDVLVNNLDYLEGIDKTVLSYSFSLGIAANSYYENQRMDSDYFFGFVLGGPLAVSYVDYLCKIAQENKVDHLLFVARDGFILKKVYDSYFKDKYGFTSGYAYVTRSCMLSSTLDHSNEKRYLKKLLELAARDGIDIDTRNNLEDEYKAHRKELMDWADKNRVNLSKHLEKECGNGHRIMAVDLNTKHFSSLKTLSCLLRDREFLGMFNIVFGHDCAIPYETFCDCAAGREFDNQANIAEILLSSTEDAITKIDDNLLPVYEKDESRYNYKSIMNGILDYVKQHASYGLDNCLMTCGEWLEFCESYILRDIDAKKKIEKHLKSSI